MAEKALKPNWKRVKFGDVVKLYGERSANPIGDGLGRYVGLEHLEPGDLRIRSWGNISDGTTFTSRFKPGQVLFGKRRAYQRKLAVADFEGVCSGDIYVFESKEPKVLLPELLPFLCQNGTFFEYAVGTSAGSLSPRTNWTSLAGYEFALPPLEEQKRIVRFLCAQTDMLVAYSDIVDSALKLEGSAYWNLALGIGQKSRPVPEWTKGRPPSVSSIPKTWAIDRLTSVAKLESGHTPSRRVAEYWNGQIGWISLGDVGELDRRSVTTSAEYVTQKGIDNSSARILPAETVILSRTATVGRTAILGVAMSTSQDFVNFICDKTKLIPAYLYYYFRALKPYWLYIAEGGGVRTIYFPFFKEIQVPLPPINEQASIVESLISVEDAVQSSKKKINQARTLLDHYLSQVFLGRLSV